MVTAVAEAKEEAKALLKQKDFDTARKQKAMVMTIEQIAEVTGLTAEEIGSL